ncbi:NUDIX hydrolase [Micromonospora sp. NPDC048835]|uniref:NUDIX hydrolase n=1 Tax=Micromonospora sp. NPDC048835 TaxID=3155147 RepID=UPI0033FDD854
MPFAPQEFTAGLPRKRRAAGLLITDPQDRVLLVEPAYKTDWEIPGGRVEADESPRQGRRAGVPRRAMHEPDARSATRRGLGTVPWWPHRRCDARLASRLVPTG